jgi:hypothetical protein
MDLKTIKTFVAMQLDGWSKPTSMFCPVANRLDEYKNTSALLGAWGHDNTELESAITTTVSAFEHLKAARNRAVNRFMAEGVSSSTTDEPKRKEAKAARLE